MNQYKIELKEVLKKEITVNAQSQKDALDFIEKVYFTSNILDFKPDEIEEMEAKIVNENGMKVENLEELNEQELEEKETQNYGKPNILDNFSIEELEKMFEEIKEKMAKNDKSFAKFERKITKILKKYSELIELYIDEKLTQN